MSYEASVLCARGEDRDLYIKSLKLGNEKKYAEMIEVFADLINKQRRQILVANLKKVVTPPRKINQLRLDDFYI
jgi:hypothetical protein